MRETVSHYRILERIGAGGMGDVYRAEDLKLKRIVALKFLSAEPTDTQQSKQSLLREAQAAASLNHPNVATIYEIGQSDGVAFIAMEYVEGESLSSIIERGPLPLGKVIEIGLQIGEALKAAHLLGLAHCDIKSGNVLVTAKGQAKLLDFGLARVAEQSSAPSEGKATTGTLGYMSPEQIRGERPDAQTDIFSFGVALFEMLAARRPFDGNSRLTLVQAILNDEPPRIGSFRDDAPLELESILRKALEKHRSQRYRTADEMLADLIRLQERLEDKRACAVVLDAETMARDSKNVESVARGLEENTVTRFLTVLWRYRRWLLIIAVLAALTAILDLFFKPQHTLSQAIAIGLLLLSGISSIAYAAARGRRRQQVYLQPVATAFRGLVPFQEADRDRFYGREVDTLALFEKVASSEFRFGVLFGESGSGKTSLVRAGLLPKLWEEGLVPIYCRSYKDPLASVMEECRRRSHLAQLEGESSVDYLRRVIRKLGSPLVVTLDQFEEFFINFRSKYEREPFISFVADCHDSANLAVRFLISIRSDFLYLISPEFDGLIPDPLLASRLYYLKNFDEDQAAEIIDSSARKANLPFEPGLSRVIARDLAVSNQVLPSELQIVGERVQSRRIFTAQEYRRAGGKESLVRSFLEEVVQASGDKEMCGLLLRSMISDENTRLTLTLDEIAKRTQRNRETVEQILRLLVGARLAREIQDDEPWRYELMHEYLIEKINQITGRVMDATQRANRLLRQYVSSYSVYKRTRIPMTRLWFIRRHSDMELGEREGELMSKSLRWGIAKAGAAVLLLAIAATLAAAALSVNKQWEGVRLSDGHTAAVRRVLFSPDGRLLVSSGEDGKVIVWDFAHRDRIATLPDHTGWVCALAFSPDGRWFVTGGNDQKVIVWDTAQLKKEVILSDHQGPVNALAFSSDGRWLASASGSDSGRTIVWDTARWEKLYDLPRAMDWGDVIFSPDGRRALIASQMWDLASASKIKDIDPGWSWGEISPDGRRLVSVDATGTVRFCDLARFWDRAELKAISERRVHSYHGRTVAFSPDGQLAASGADDIILWDAATQAMLLRFNYSAQVWRLAFSPDGKWLVSSHDDGAILVWDVADRKQVASFSEHAASVHAVAFSADGKRLASAGEDRSVIVWDAKRGEKEAVLQWHTSRVTGVAFSPNGKRIASTDMDDTLVVWDLVEGRPQWTNGPRLKMTSYCVTFSPDGRRVANTSGVYDSADGRQVANFIAPVEVLKNSPGSIYGVAFSPDGQRIVCVTDRGAIILWDTETWKAVEGVEMSTPVISVSFSPDSKHFVTGDDDGIVRLWEIGPLRQIAVIGRHAARIKSVAFSPDGSEVASAGDDKTVALWDVNRRSLITHIGTHTSPVLSVAFSADGKRIASGEHDKSVHIYTHHRALWGYRLD